MDREKREPMQATQKKKKRWWIPCLIVLAVLLLLGAAAGMLWHTYQQGLQVQLLGDATLVHEYQESFTDPGAAASFNGFFYDEQSVAVAVDGKVDTEKLGTYQLTYSSEYKLDFYFFALTCKAAQTRSVTVVDTQAPTIQLHTDPDYFTLPGREYQEEGFTATDNHDGDITAAVQRTQEGDLVTYRVADASGNVTEVTRTIEYSDPVAPELTLLGAEKILLRRGYSYKEPGFAAQDNCDGDITDKVTVSGTVDCNRSGTYVLEYSVEDAAGNITTASRTVIVAYVNQVSGLPGMPSQTPVEPNGRTVYLTFDDGPSAYTKQLLDVLDKYGVQATFFVVRGNYVETLKRMEEAGHTVAMHSDTHDYHVIYSSEEAYFADLYAIQNKIETAIGYKPMMLRFPGGSSNTVSRRYCKGIMTTVTQRVKELGYRYFDWNVDSGDVSTAKTAKEVYQNVTWGMHYTKNAIVLQHDIIDFSVDAVEDIIKWGLVNGYTFKPLTMDSPECEFRVAN